MSKLCLSFALWPGCLIIYFLVGVPFTLLWDAGRADVLTCQRLSSEPPICHQQSWRLLGFHFQTTEWQLYRVVVVKTDSNLYTLDLETSQGYVDLPYYLDDDQKTYQDFDRLNRLLKGSPQPQFEIRHNNDLSENSIVVIVILIAFLFLIYYWLCRVFLFPIIRYFTQSS